MKATRREFLAGGMSVGLAQFDLPVPALPELAGGRFYGQFINGNDPRVNPGFPLTTSQALEITLGTGLTSQAHQMSVVYSIQSLARAKFGFAYPGEGPVVKIRY